MADIFQIAKMHCIVQTTVQQICMVLIMHRTPNLEPHRSIRESTGKSGERGVKVRSGRGDHCSRKR